MQQTGEFVSGDKILEYFSQQVGKLTQDKGAQESSLVRLVELVAPRGGGKTFLMGEIGTSAKEQGLNWSYIDLMADKRVPLSPVAVMETIIDSLPLERNEQRKFDRPTDLFVGNNPDLDLATEYLRLSERERDHGDKQPQWLKDWLRVEVAFLDIVAGLEMPVVVAFDNFIGGSSELEDFVEDRVVKPLVRRDSNAMVVAGSIHGRKWKHPETRWSRRTFEIPPLSKVESRELLAGLGDEIPEPVQAQILSLAGGNPGVIVMGSQEYQRDSDGWIERLYERFVKQGYLGRTKSGTAHERLTTDYFEAISLVHEFDPRIGVKLLEAFDPDLYGGVSFKETDRANFILRSNWLVSKWIENAQCIDSTVSRISQAYWREKDSDRFNRVSQAMADFCADFAERKVGEAKKWDIGSPTRKGLLQIARKYRRWEKYYLKRIVG